MKKLMLYLFIIFAFYANLSAQKESSDLSISGTWSYSIDYKNNNVTINGDEILNSGKNKTSSILLSLALTNEPYSGGKFSGWIIFEYRLDPLDPGYHYEKITKSLNMAKQPKNGKYFVAIILFETKNSQYGIVDYMNFDDPITFTNTTDSKINNLLSELNREQANYNFYYYGMQGLNDFNLIMQYTNNALASVNRITQIKMDLINLGYYVDTPYLNSYYLDSVSFTPFSEIKESISKTPNINEYSMTPNFIQPPVIDSSNLSNGNKPRYSQAYIMQLENDLKSANHDLDFAQQQFDWAIKNNSSTLTVSQMLNQAQRHVNECENRLREARGY